MKAIYNRVSTDGQEFTQQMQCIYSYLKRIGEDWESMLHVEEKVSGSVKHTERKLYKLLQECESGSTIYISELSRLGRNMSDLSWKRIRNPHPAEHLRNDADSKCLSYLSWRRNRYQEQM